MGHVVTITGDEKYRSGVRIEFEVEIDGSVEGVPEELDGEVREGHFNLDYAKYRRNQEILHAEDWAEKVVDKAVEDFNPSKSFVGESVELDN